MKHKLTELLAVVFLFSACSLFLCAQDEQQELDLNVMRFRDSAHHWYDISDEERVINPLPDRPRYDQSEIKKIADNILLFQKDNGGWAKNYDMQAILSDAQRDSVIKDKSVLNTTIDNGATHSQLTYLAEVYSKTSEAKYKEAFFKGINYLLKAQYENGGWPQFYPDTSGYSKYITFNDYAMVGVLELFQRVILEMPEYNFIDDELKQKIVNSFNKGIDCVLKCQIIDNGVKTAWCQQHDNVTFKPQDARTFEKASIANAESAELVWVLMRIEKPDSAVIDAVDSALKWFKDSEIHNIRVDWIDAEHADFVFHSTDQDRVVVEDSTAPAIWARFYELGTHRPIFCGRDGIVKYSMKEIDRDRRTGYGWYTYLPQRIYEIYPEWKKRISGGDSGS